MVFSLNKDFIMTNTIKVRTAIERFIEHNKNNYFDDLSFKITHNYDAELCFGVINVAFPLEHANPSFNFDLSDLGLKSSKLENTVLTFHIHVHRNGDIEIKTFKNLYTSLNVKLCVNKLEEFCNSLSRL